MRLGLIARSQTISTLKKFFDTIKRPDLKSTIPKLPLKAVYINYFMNVLQSLAREQGSDRFLEKTPQHLYHIPLIEQYVPGGQFIHLFRNGTDVVASLYEVTHRYPKRWHGAWDIDTCIEYWSDIVRLSQTYLNRPNHRAVRYEKLLQDPQGCLQQICQFLNLEYTEALIENYHQSSQFLINKTSRKVHSQIRDINTASQKFNSLFDDSQREYIIQKVSQVDLDTIPFL